MQQRVERVARISAEARCRFCKCALDSNANVMNVLFRIRRVS